MVNTGSHTYLQTEKTACRFIRRGPGVKSWPDPADAPSMSLPLYAWLLLAVLAYLLGLQVLRLLAIIHHREISRHDLVRRAKEMRREYLEEVMRRRMNASASVEVMDE